MDINLNEKREFLGYSQRGLIKLKDFINIIKKYDNSLYLNEILETLEEKLVNSSSILEIEDEKGRTYLDRIKEKEFLIDYSELEILKKINERLEQFKIDIIFEIFGKEIFNGWENDIKRVFDTFLEKNKNIYLKYTKPKVFVSNQSITNEFIYEHLVRDEAIKKLLNWGCYSIKNDSLGKYDIIQEENKVRLDKLTIEIKKLKDRYEVIEFKHALTILKNDFSYEFGEILDILNNFKLLASDILASGGNKTSISDKVDSTFYSKGWKEVEFDTGISLQRKEYEKKAKKAQLREIEEYKTPTHKIDCFKNRIAFEIEWNNKTEFYDRDLNNFRLLFDLNAISVGVIFTRSKNLDNVFKELEGEFKKRNPTSKKKLIEKYGASSTRMDKLIPRIEGRSAGGCPLLIIGISERTYENDLEKKTEI